MTICPKCQAPNAVKLSDGTILCKNPKCLRITMKNEAEKKKKGRIPEWYDYNGIPCDGCGMPTDQHRLIKHDLVMLCPDCSEKANAMKKALGDDEDD